jgi:hypothetical protein
MEGFAPYLPFAIAVGIGSTWVDTGPSRIGRERRVRAERRDEHIVGDVL